MNIPPFTKEPPKSPPSGRLAGLACLIVGGTSGIGLETARRFLQEGGKLVVTGLTDEAAQGAAEFWKPLGLIDALPLDVRDEAAVDRVLDVARDLLGGRIDILFHVAGLSGRRRGDAPLRDCTIEGWDYVFEANARGTFLTNRAVVRQMLSQSVDANGLRGTILNMGSVLATSPAPEHFDTVAYAASKGAIRSLTLASASRYAADRVRFNLLSPSLIETPMSARAMNDPSIRGYLETKQPITGGPGTSLDCAEAALFLCEPASRFITGIELKADGGWSISDGQIAAHPSP